MPASIQDLNRWRRGSPGHKVLQGWDARDLTWSWVAPFWEAGGKRNQRYVEGEDRLEAGPKLQAWCLKAKKGSLFLFRRVAVIDFFRWLWSQNCSARSSPSVVRGATICSASSFRNMSCVRHVPSVNSRASVKRWPHWSIPFQISAFREWSVRISVAQQARVSAPPKDSLHAALFLLYSHPSWSYKKNISPSPHSSRRPHGPN